MLKHLNIKRAFLLAVSYTLALYATGIDATEIASTEDATTAKVPAFEHVVVVIEENHTDTDIIHNPNAPYMTSLANLGAEFSNYHAVEHPSQPNYFALFSGSTHGITSDNPVDESGPSLGGEMKNAKKSIIGYVESPGVRKHNPWESFSDSQGIEKPFTSFPTDFAELPDLAFVIPNLNDDMHNGTVQTADAWLKKNIGPYATWAKTHNSLLIVTWDEAEDENPTNLIPTIYYGANVATGRYIEDINHYSTLRTIETIFKLKALGKSADVSPVTNVWEP